MEKKKCVVLAMETQAASSLIGTQDYDKDTTVTLTAGVKIDPCTGVHEGVEPARALVASP